MKSVESLDDVPEMKFIAFVEGHTDPVVSEFDDEGQRVVKSAKYRVIGSLSIPPIDEVQLEVWETINDPSDQDRNVLVESIYTALDAGDKTQTERTNIYDGYVFHTLQLMFGDELISEIRSAGDGLMAATCEGVDTMEPEAVPLFAQRTIEAFLEMKKNGSLIKM